MKQSFFSLLLLLFGAVGSAQNENTVNAILGDESFLAHFQQSPTEKTDEVLRLQTHLQYVEYLLRNKDVSHLAKEQGEKRSVVLQLLHNYTQNGIFPKNYDYGERRPCFIDRDGNACAVGYLIEKTEGRTVAEGINQKHQYDYLLDMKEEIVAEWADTHGLTLEECAMIQPTYGYVPPGYASQTQNVSIKTGYGVASGFAIGLNAGVNVMNLRPQPDANAKVISYIGLLSGASQIVLGLANVRQDEMTNVVNGPAVMYSYKAQNNLSYLNIAAGTATVFTSTFNLLLNKKLRDKRNAFNLYGYPGSQNQMLAGLCFTRTL
ncbi:MAG TPA: hypothetical protein VM871_10100 [Flavisolibacter sp.]|jgi:hypothetical protein|nr:hypothetical protein [Flavisolibacter sp.]